MNKKDPYGGIGKEGYWQTVRRWFLHRRLVCIGLVVLAVIYTTTILAPVIAPYGSDTIAGPFGAPPGLGLLLGADRIGRDMFFHLLYIARISLLVGVPVTTISTTVGVSLGLPEGYFEGWLNIATMHFIDVIMPFPYILLVLVVTVIFEPGLWSIILVLGPMGWPGIARLMRDDMLSLQRTNFIKSGIVAGVPARYILLSKILLSTVTPVLMYATPIVALSMLDEASLSFLGIGVQPPTTSPGNILSGTQPLTVLTKWPRLRIPSGPLIMILVIAINFVGGALGDALDPSVALNLGGAKQDTPEQDAAKQDTPNSL